MDSERQHESTAMGGHRKDLTKGKSLDNVKKKLSTIHLLVISDLHWLT